MIHPTPQGVINFWRWFGDSEMVDTKGRPLIFYHATHASFAAFDLGRPTVNSTTFGDEETIRAGIFVTRSKADAEAYLRGSDEGGRLIPVYISADNVLDIAKGVNEIQAARLAKVGMSERFIYNHLNSWSAFDGEGGKSTVGLIRRAGYDAVAIRDENPVTLDGFESVVVFSPTQIKSATGNRGTFDPSDPVLTNPPRFPAISYAEAHAWEMQAAARGVSAVARSHRGFMRAYEDAGSFAKLSPWWKRRREGFLARHIAQAMRGENIWERTRSGIVRPTRRSLAMIMWGFMPPRKPANCRPGVW